LKYSAPCRDAPIFNDDDDKEDEGSSDVEDDEDMNSLPDDQDEYDDSEEAEDEDYPYANSDPEEQANHLKNGNVIESSQSSPDKMENGESKIEKFVQESSKFADKLDKLDINEMKIPNGIEDKENIDIAKQVE